MTNPACCWWGCSLPHIATSDLDIAVVGQLPPSNLPLCNEFEPDSMKVVGFKAALRYRALRKQDLKHAPGNAHHTLIFAHLDAELDDEALGIRSGVRRKAKKHSLLDVLPMFFRRSHRCLAVSRLLIPCGLTRSPQRYLK